MSTDQESDFKSDESDSENFYTSPVNCQDNNMAFYNISFLEPDKECGAEGSQTDVNMAKLSDSFTSQDLLASEIDTGATFSSSHLEIQSPEDKILVIEPCDISSDKIMPKFNVTPNLQECESQTTIHTEKFEKLCGWLNKLGNRAIVKTYKTRWFVYGDNTCKLYYYRTPQDLLPLGEIDIHNASFSFQNSDTERAGLFNISSEGREYFLDARNPQTRMYWLQELQRKRREFSNIRTSLSRTKVSLMSATQKSIDEGLLARQKSLKTTTDPDHVSSDHMDYLKPPDLLIGQSSALLPPPGVSITNFSLSNFRTEIRNYVAQLRSPASSPSKDFYTVFDKSPTEEWALVDPEPEAKTSAKTRPSELSMTISKNKSPTQSSVVTTATKKSPNTPTATSANSTNTNQKFSFSHLRKILKKGNEEMEISLPTRNTNVQCQKCVQMNNYLTCLKDEHKLVEEELQATREVTKLLQKEIDKQQLQIQSGKEMKVLDGSSPAALLKTRDEKIVDLEYLLAKTQEEKEMIRQQARDQCGTIDTQSDQISMLQEMLTAKDDVIRNLTNQVYDLENSQVSTSGQSTAAPVLRVFTDASVVENLKEVNQVYETQNKFLCKEILELNELRRNDENRESLLQMQYAQLEARFYQTRSKYLFLLNELKTPVRGGDEGKSQEIIDQLLSDALNPNDEEKAADLLASQNSTMEYDRYGFLKNYDSDEDPLVTMATELQHRSNELEMQIKELDQSGIISHQVKWENFIVGLGDKGLTRSQELKDLIRGGIPHQYREPIWKGCVNLHVPTRADNCYQSLVSSSQKNRHNPATKQIELDLLRTLPHNKYYEAIDSDGVVKLRRVLLAYSWHNPEIGYCQGLNRLAAIALLFLSEEDAFWCLVAIIEVIMPQEYYTRTLMGAQADQRVLKDLLQEKLPRLHSHLENHDVDMALFTFNWFLTIFVDNIPPETFLRVWDVLLYEGSKVLFRYALAFFKYREEEILKQTSAININKYLRVIGEKMTDVRRLSQIAFHELNPFPRRVVTSRRHYHVIQVKAELRELDAIREDFRSNNVPTDRVEYYSDEEMDSDDKDRRSSPTQLTAK